MKPDSTLAARMREAGFKLTDSRLAVLRAFEGAHEHLNPEEVLRRGKRHCPKLGRATVYRTLDLLTKLGVLRPLYLHGGRPAFTRVESGHHHLVCSRCETIVELPHASLAAAVQRLAKESGFEVSSELLEVYGVCRDCRGRA